MAVIDKNSRIEYISNNILAYDSEWQYPAITELQAFNCMKQLSSQLNEFIYVAFPWATLIDGIRNSKASVEFMLLELNYLRSYLATMPKTRVVTVVQHILFGEFYEILESIGITDVFWSHKIKGRDWQGKLRLHPFPLFPAQTKDDEERALSTVYTHAMLTSKPYVANFIGAYNPKIYLSDVRDCIFKDADRRGYLIKKREAWHFERVVYEVQIRGKVDGSDVIAREEEDKKEYIQAIKASRFTFCPTGSGPNSIRLFETLCLGSVPVLLTDTLDLPGDLAAWQRACVIVGDSAEGYKEARNIIEAMSEGAVVDMLNAGRELLAMVGPSAYGRLITTTLAKK